MKSETNNYVLNPSKTLKLDNFKPMQTMAAKVTEIS